MKEKTAQWRALW